MKFKLCMHNFTKIEQICFVSFKTKQIMWNELFANHHIVTLLYDIDDSCPFLLQIDRHNGGFHNICLSFVDRDTIQPVKLPTGFMLFHFEKEKNEGFAIANEKGWGFLLSANEEYTLEWNDVNVLHLYP